jgi:hypothetical protein
MDALERVMLKDFHANEDQEIFVVETSAGCMTTAVDLRVQEQIKTGEVFMDRYREVFAALAMWVNVSRLTKVALSSRRGGGSGATGGWGWQRKRQGDGDKGRADEDAALGDVLGGLGARGLSWC